MKFGSLIEFDLLKAVTSTNTKPEVVISQPPMEICRQNLGLLIDFDLLKTVTSTNTKPELLFSGRGRHLEKWI